MKKRSILMSGVLVSQTVVAPIAVMADTTNKDQAFTIQPYQTKVNVTERQEVEHEISVSKRLFDESYHFTVARDYNQQVIVKVQNNGVTEEVYYRVVDTYKDIEIGFADANKKETAFPILENEAQEIPLNFFMQNAEQTAYQFVIEAVSAQTGEVLDTANVHVALEDYTFKLDTELTANGDSAIQTLSLKNLGDRIPDLTIIADDALKDVVSFAPAVTNAILEQDDTLNIAIIPDYEKLKEKAYSGHLIALSGNQQIKIPVTFDQYTAPVFEFTVDDILNEYKREQQAQQALLYEQITKDVEDELEVEAQLIEDFTINGGEMHFAATKDSAAVSNFTMKAEKVIFDESMTEKIEFDTATVDGITTNTVKLHLTQAEYYQMIRHRQSALFSTFASLQQSQLQYREIAEAKTGFLPAEVGYTITITEVALDSNIPVVSQVGNWNTGAGLLTNGMKYAYYQENYTGSNTVLGAYNVLLGINTIANAATFLPHPAVKVVGGTAALLSGEMMGWMEGDYLGAYPGNTAGISLMLQTLISQCINRQYLKNSIPVYNGGSGVSYGDMGYISVKNYPHENGTMANEDFSYSVNGVEVEKKANVTPRQLTYIGFDTDTISNGVIQYEQRNTHHNRGSYVIESDVKVYIPVEVDSVFQAPTLEEVLAHVTPIAPDFSVSQNFVQFSEPVVVEGVATTLQFSIFNEGLQDATAPVTVYINDTLIHSDTYALRAGEKRDITIPNVQVIAPKTTVKIDINGKQHVYEKDVENNTTTLTYDVKENDNTGPQIDLRSPLEGANISYIAANVRDPLSIKQTEMYVNGVAVPHKKVANNIIATLEEPLPLGTHTIKVVATDYGNNTSTKEYTVTAIAEKTVTAAFTEESYTITEGESFNLAEALVIKEDDVIIPTADYPGYFYVEFKQNNRYVNTYHDGLVYTPREVDGEVEVTVRFNGQKMTATLTILEAPSKKLTLQNEHLQDVRLLLYGRSKENFYRDLSQQHFLTAPILRILQKDFDAYQQFIVQLAGPTVFGMLALKEQDFTADTLTLTTHKLTIEGFSEKATVTIQQKRTGLRHLFAQLAAIQLVADDYLITVHDTDASYVYDLSITENMTISKEPESKAEYIALAVKAPRAFTMESFAIDHYYSANRYEPVLENGVYSVPKSEHEANFEFVGSDANYRYLITSHAALDADFTYELPTTYQTTAYVQSTEVEAGRKLYYDGLIMHSTGQQSTLQRITNKADNADVKFIAKYVDTKDKTKLYEFEFNQSDYAIPAPPVGGTYTLLIYPNINSVNTEVADTDSPTPPTENIGSSLSSGGGSSNRDSATGSSSRDRDYDFETPATGLIVKEEPTLRLAVTGKDLIGAATTPISETSSSISVYIDANFVGAKEEDVYTLTTATKANTLSLQVAANNGLNVSYFDAPIQLTVEPAVFGSELDTNKVVLRKVGDEYMAVPHKIVDGQLVITTRHAGEYVYVDHRKTFKDIEKLANKAQILALANRGIINGVSADLFAPNHHITRAQFAAMLTRLLAIAPTTETHFADVKGKWYEKNVQALYEAGIIKGVSSTKFDPTATLTRTQAALMMHRALSYAGYDLSQLSLTNPYNDQAAIRDEAIESVSILYALNMMTGRADGSFGPSDYLTRAQMAKVLYMFMDIAQ